VSDLGLDLDSTMIKVYTSSAPCISLKKNKHQSSHDTKKDYSGMTGYFF
jgi:hypothetical protein